MDRARKRWEFYEACREINEALSQMKTALNVVERHAEVSVPNVEGARAALANVRDVESANSGQLSNIQEKVFKLFRLDAIPCSVDVNKNAISEARVPLCEALRYFDSDSEKWIKSGRFPQEVRHSKRNARKAVDILIGGGATEGRGDVSLRRSLRRWLHSSSGKW